MNPSIDHSDEFFREQLRQLQAKGYSPEKPVFARVLRRSAQVVPKSR
jgi:hypothetical protein